MILHRWAYQGQLRAGSVAYELYKSSNRRSHKLADLSKKAFCRNVPIDFLGVCVSGTQFASFGFLSAGTLPFVGTNDMIRVFRQTLSLDGVRRSAIRPIIFILPSTRLVADKSLLASRQDPA
ncbi:hypothetical protein BJV78DRAFT_511659 [Lactifluus subvellereus]|nr:hypothetical protein BJV78DRAFT_511659 [Lactifluus subvellereus]